MAKARFPGKPSKLTPNSRLRVSVKCFDLKSDLAKDTADQISLGLRLFQSAFGQIDKDEDFHGFVDTSSSTLTEVEELAVNEDSHVERDKVTTGTEVTELLKEKSRNVTHCTTSEPSRENCEGSGVEHSETQGGEEESVLKPNLCTTLDESRKLAKKGKKSGEKSPKKFILPSRSAHSSRPIIPNKRFLDESIRVEPKKCLLEEKESSKEMTVHQEKLKTSEDETRQEKDRIKKEIERYTDIIITDRQADERRRLKEERMREKIQQLLRSQWESRLVGDGSHKGEVSPGRGSSMSMSSEDDSPSCSNKKIILRKPRLQLNQRLLRQLRQPSRLQQLSEQMQQGREDGILATTSTSETPAANPRQCHSPSVLRPPQLTFQTSPISGPLPSDASRAYPSMETALSTPDSFMEQTGMNPLGCAFVTDTDHGEEKRIPGTVVCGVCGAIRKYSFILQARKFGTFSCEPCRKFISRVLRNRARVKCQNQAGRCISAPVLRGSPFGRMEDGSSSVLASESPTSRCEACRLKLALNGFRMRDADHDELRKLLPAEMQPMVPTAAERPLVFSTAPNRGQIVKIPHSVLSTQETENTMSVRDKISSKEAKTSVIRERLGGGWTKKSIQRDNAWSVYVISPCGEKFRSASDLQRRVGQSLQLDPRCFSFDPPAQSLQENAGETVAEHCAGSRAPKIKATRTEAEVKGPRVKNVCRSAMLVLGQPKAVFEGQQPCPDHSSEEVQLCTDPVCVGCPHAKSDNACFTSPSATAAANNLQLLSMKNVFNISKNLDSSLVRPNDILEGEQHRTTTPDSRPLYIEQVVSPAVRAYQSQAESSSSQSQDQSNNSRKLRRNLIAEERNPLLFINFWEPFALRRLWAEGFAIMGATLGVSALCYLCGSAGNGELICCTGCCEPFHSFCAANVGCTPSSSPVSSVEDRENARNCSHWSRDTLLKEITWKNVSAEQTEEITSSFSDPAPKKPWLCRRCQPCHVCGIGTDDKFSCFSCGSNYHWPCLPVAYPVPDQITGKPWKCFSCERCRNCGRTGAMKAVGHFLYCSGCYTEERRNKFCPVCLVGHCDEDVWLLECSCCGGWIHTRCQQITQEQYFLWGTGENRFECSVCAGLEQNEEIIQEKLNICCDTLLSWLSQERLWRKLVELSEAGGVQVNTGRIKENIAQNSYKKSLDFFHDLVAVVESCGLSYDLKNIFCSYFPWSFSSQSRREPRAESTCGSTIEELSFDVQVKYDAETDWRCCLMCKKKGEGDPTREGRLLHCGNNEWVHVNCALWSNEVYENSVGGLQNVYAALSRARTTRCDICHYKGASLSCCAKTCAAAYHFPCALKAGILLLEDKNIFCMEHEPSLAKVRQTHFEVQRWVYVDLQQELRHIKPLPPNCVQLVIGSLKIQSIGELKSDIPAYKAALCPANFRCERVFWSVKEPWKRTTYTICSRFIPGQCDTDEQDVNVTVSHEDEDVIMAESGLNIPEMETQEDSELIHMVLEDADFEQELVRGTSSGRSPPPEVRDSGFYSDVQSETSPCPVEQETNQSLEAWLADPEHAVILLDSALLASLDIDANPLPGSSSSEIPTPSCSGNTADANSTVSSDQQNPPVNKRFKHNRRVSYSQWKKMKLENQRLKSMSSSRPAVDWNGNEPEWNPGGSSLVASIKVSPLIGMNAVDSVPRSKNPNILQLDGAADSSEAESDVLSIPLTSTTVEEPVKCTRCKRCYRTLQSFNKHAQTCDEVLSSSTSDEEFDETLVLKKGGSEAMENNPIQVPIVNSSSQITAKSPVDGSNKSGSTATKINKTRSRRKPKLNTNTSRRPLAARVPITTSGIQMVAQHPAQQLRTFHITLPQPMSAPAPSQHVVYVSNNVASAELPQYPVAPAQQHVLIIPPMESGIIHTPQLHTTPAVYGTQPLLQYYGSYPSDILTLGTVNMGMSSIPTLLPGMAPMQCHIPWETANVNPVIMLPPQQQQIQSYPIINAVIPMEQHNYIQIQEPPPPPQSVPCVMNVDPQPSTAQPEPDKDPHFETFDHAVDTVIPEEHEDETEMELTVPVPETTVTFDTPEDVSHTDGGGEFDEDFHDPGHPPRPSYSYRLAMNSEKKNPLTAALIAAAITTADLEPSEEPSPPFGTQQLKVTAESDESQRTFRIKAASSSEIPRGPHIVYELTSEDGFHASSASITDLWKQLLSTVQDARLAYKLEPLPDAVLSREEGDALKVLGLNHPALRYLLEQLPNASSCANYEFLYHQPEPLAPLTGSPFGCARAAPYSGRIPHDIFSWLASEHRPKPQLDSGVNGAETFNVTRRANSFDLLPISARFRNLRQTSRYSVGVYRSGIHGRGLFCKRDFESGEMVVEYAGEIIRSIVSDKREKEYEAKGIGCYMFRIDDQTVVDATMHGNAARFINHSCEPNCYSRIVDVQGKKQIVIFALRRIQRGEELTYDYKFPIEEVKIPCTCGSRRCRKYLN